MEKIILLLAIASFAYAADPTDEVYCNYTLTGDETMSNAVPISGFRTSGFDFVRPHWCITHCSDRKSLKAEILFQPSNSSSAAYKRRVIDMGGQMHVEVELLSGIPSVLDVNSDNTFCIDKNVADTVDAVVDKYDTLEQISEGLNYFINRPGWAYLVYEMGPPPTISASVNVHQDVNMCVKDIFKTNKDGTYTTYNVFAGLVQV